MRRKGEEREEAQRADFKTRKTDFIQEYMCNSKQPY